MVIRELDFIYITTDGKKFLTKKEAERHEEELSEGENYGIFNR